MEGLLNEQRSKGDLATAPTTTTTIQPLLAKHCLEKAQTLSGSCSEKLCEIC